VPFVDAVVPNAKYINIVRNGGDVVASAMKRWGAKLDLTYILKKARFVPVEDIPYYGLRYGTHRLRKLVSNTHALPTWGPIYKGMREDVKNRTLAEVCALQWVNCVDSSCMALSSLDRGRVLSLRYEEFVRSPVSKMKEVTDFLNLPVDSAVLKKSVCAVEDKSVGLGDRLLERDDAVAAIIGDRLHNKYNQIF
jgi:hypothetical protein